MKSLITVAKREWRALFDSPIAYIFIAVFLIITLGIFRNEVFEAKQASLRHLFEILDCCFFILVPALAMRQSS